MLRWLRFSGRIVCVAAVLALGACAQAELVSHAAKKMQPSTPEPRAGEYKIGKPYEVAGVWYYPRVEYGYRETGIASWYGPNFHGNRTANGETFDQYKLTAAHRTLPLPSMVRVTNLENGRSVVLRVNDRGPFKNNRIIDVSMRAADLLGFRKTGTAKVLVEVLDTESRQLAVLAQTRVASAAAPQPVPVVPVVAAPLDGAVNGTDGAGQAAPEAAQPYRAALEEPQPDGRITRLPVRATSIYIQAGAFLRRDNAVRLGARLGTFGPTAITETFQGDQRFYRVRLGPMDSVAAADQLLATLLQNGHTDARVVVD
jgi:rare lipoprotein A